MDQPSPPGCRLPAETTRNEKQPRFRSYFKAKKFALGPERKSLLYRQHSFIFEAIKKRNAQNAKVRMLEHLEYVEEVIRRDFFKGRGKGGRMMGGSPRIQA